MPHNDRKEDEDFNDKDKEKDTPFDCYLYGAKFYCTQSMANYSKLVFDICGKTDPEEASRLNHRNIAQLNHESQLINHGRGIPFDDPFGMVDSHNINGNYNSDSDVDNDDGNSTNIGITGGITSGSVSDDLNHAPGYYTVNFSENGGRKEFIVNSNLYTSNNENKNNENNNNNNRRNNKNRGSHTLFCTFLL